LSRTFLKYGWMGIALLLLIALVIFPACTGEGPVEQQVSVHMLIRNNDSRLDIGNYVGNQLEDLGFKVTRQYGAGSDLAPIWQGDPTLGEWNVYTGAWINTAVPRDEGSNFGFFFTPLGDSTPLWQAETPTTAFMDVATPLFTNDFTSMTERQTLFEAAVPLSMEDSARIFLDDRTSFTALHADILAAADAYGGIEGSQLWGHTMCLVDESGTPILPAWDGGNATLTAKIATEDLLVQPWNPIGGTNWAFDQFPIRATRDAGFEYDVNDGLAWPNLAEKAEVYVQSGQPCSQGAGSTGWLTLDTTTYTSPIPVPATAYGDWDAVTQTWIEAGADVTAKSKIVVYYPEGTFATPLHDGSTLSMADFMLYAILTFDRAKPDSAIYDEDYVPLYTAFMSHFKGVEFDTTQVGYDLVVTTYDDQVALDAELMAKGNSWFPVGSMVGGNDLGEWIFDNLGLGILAERDLDSAFTQNKATAEGIEWMNFIAGPSLVGGGDVYGLVNYLADVQDSESLDYEYIPYLATMGDYITGAEALVRYQNLQAFYNSYGNLWVGTGPYFLADVDSIGDVMTLNAFEEYPGDGSAWFFMMDPEPVSPPAHDGAWFDVVTVEKEDSHEAGIARIQTGGDLDVYAAGLSDADLFEEVQADSTLHYYMSAGLFDELTFNPSHTEADPYFPATGELNPFAIHAVREALNLAIDRDYIVGEIWGGMAYARYTCVGTQTGDALNRYPALFAATAAAYAYDFDAADDAIEAAMLAIDGVTRHTDGTYWYTPPA
jgi:peptide/nickel transport system substrate-binding protein